MTIREMAVADYDAVITVWRAAEGVTLRGVDTRERIAEFLAANPGMSFVAVDGDTIVGAVLCGTDGRRGYLQHLAVAATHRRRGIGRSLAESCVEALRARGIDKCHLMVVSGNASAKMFWERLGWVERDDVILMSRTTPGAENP
jgi:ribosomal protein S18 acetylase RimI-like enzyme